MKEKVPLAGETWFRRVDGVRAYVVYRDRFANYVLRDNVIDINGFMGYRNLSSMVSYWEKIP